MGGEGGDCLSVGDEGPVFFEFGDGGFGGVDGGDFIDLGLIEGEFVWGELFFLGEVEGLFEEGFPGGKEVRVVFEDGGEAGVEVEHLELMVEMEELLRFAGAVEIDPVFSELLEGGEWGEGAVDKDAGAFFAVDGAVEDEGIVFAGGEVERLEDGIDAGRICPVEFSLDFAVGGALADDGLICSGPGKEAEGAEEDAFPGAGFAGDGCETGVEL